MKTYRITRGAWIVTVKADDATNARYKVDQALRLFKETGRKPSGATIERKY